MTGAKPRILILSAFYCLIMVAYSSFNSILTKIPQEDGDKAHNPSSSSSSTPPTTPLASCCSEHPPIKYILAAIGGLLNGIGSGFLFSCVGRYIHNTCAKYGELERKGFYYGLFSTLYTTSTIVGALVVIFGLDFLTHY